MSAQMQIAMEVSTPEVNSLSPVVGTTFDLVASLARQKQKKAEQREAKRQAEQSEIVPLAPEDVAHRKGFWEFVEAHSEPWHKQHLARLLELWLQWNGEHYQGALTPPYILLSEPVAPNVLGDCARISGFGGRSQIRLRPALLRGTHPNVRGEAVYAQGRFLFVADVLLHEMIHQWQQEVLGNSEPHYHGHGPIFRDKANEIGERLGLSRVRTSKNRSKKDKGLPSCSQWPHDVRSAEYYQGAYRKGRKFCSTQELCARASHYAEDPTNENLLELGRVAIAYHTALEARKANRAHLGDEDGDLSLLLGTTDTDDEMYAKEGAAA